MTADLGTRIDAAQARWEKRAGRPFPWHHRDGYPPVSHLEVLDARNRVLAILPASARVEWSPRSPDTARVGFLAVAKHVLVWTDGRRDETVYKHPIHVTVNFDTIVVNLQLRYVGAPNAKDTQDD